MVDQVGKSLDFTPWGAAGCTGPPPCASLAPGDPAVPGLTTQRMTGGNAVCRNIKTLFNFDPPATDDEIRAASLQFVRKLSGFNKPSQTNAAAFEDAVDKVTRVAAELLDNLTTHAEPKNREVEAAKARARAAKRFGTSSAA